MSRTFLIFFNFVNENHSHLRHRLYHTNSCLSILTQIKTYVFVTTGLICKATRKPLKMGRLGQIAMHAAPISAKLKYKSDACARELVQN